MRNDGQASFNRVMIIDDNLIDLYIGARIIVKNNFGKEVLQYSSGLDALKYLLDNQENISVLPQVIFLDIYMPFMNGFEFMAQYDKLSIALKQHCKVFIISSSRNEQDITKACNDQNIIAMIEKPLTIEFLNRTLKIYCLF